MKDAEQFVLVVGNLGDGFTFVGPFASEDDAINHTLNRRIDEWIIVELVNPGPALETKEENK